MLKINFPRRSVNRDKTVGEELERFMDMSEDKTINHIFTRHREDIIEKMSKIKQGENMYKGEAGKRLIWNKPSWTVKENHGYPFIHPILNRVLTPRECAVLQSFPDDFIFQGVKKWQLVQIGNAVPPLMARAIAGSVMEMIE